MPEFDFTTLRDALSLKHALHQADTRLFGEQEPPPQHSPTIVKVPLVTPDGRAFARHFLNRPDAAVVVPADTKPNTLVHFSNAAGHSLYGLITQSASAGKLPVMHLNPLSAADMANLVRDNPEVVRLSLTYEHVVNSETYSELHAPRHILDYFLDPLDRLLFKLQLTLLGRLIQPYTSNRVLLTELFLCFLFAFCSLASIWIVLYRH